MRKAEVPVVRPQSPVIEIVKSETPQVSPEPPQQPEPSLPGSIDDDMLSVSVVSRLSTPPVTRPESPELPSISPAVVERPASPPQIVAAPVRAATPEGDGDRQSKVKKSYPKPISLRRRGVDAEIQTDPVKFAEEKEVQTIHLYRNIVNK